MQPPWNPNQLPPGYPQPGQAAPGYPQQAPQAAPPPQGTPPGYAPPPPPVQPNWGAPQAPVGPGPWGGPAPASMPPGGYGQPPAGYQGPGAGQSYGAPAAPAMLPPPARLESNEQDFPVGTHIVEFTNAACVGQDANLFVLSGTIVQSQDPNVRPGTQGAFKRPLKGAEVWSIQKASDIISQACIALLGKTAQEAATDPATAGLANELVQSAGRGAPTLAGQPLKGKRCVIVVTPNTRPNRRTGQVKINPNTGQPYNDTAFYPLR